jgi:hypothetical protein
MPKLLNGVFDNRETMQREAWTKGELMGQWPAIRCGDVTQTTAPWERDMLEKPCGSYPPRPPQHGE